MTLGNMRHLGVQRLIAYCLNPSCRHEGLIDISKYPEETEVPSFAEKAECAKCWARGRYIGWRNTMSRLIVSLSIIATAGTWVSTASADTVRLDQVLFTTSPDWYVIQRSAVKDGQLAFRGLF